MEFALTTEQRAWQAEVRAFSSELRQRIADVGMRDRQAPLNRFGGGASEVLRDVIAQRGHKMPSYGR